MKKKYIILIITVILLISCIVCGVKMNSQTYDYQTVNVTVSSSKTINYKVGTARGSKYEVVVKYNGKDYDLINVHNSYSYPKGRVVEAYLYNDKLYANVEGIKSNNGLSTIYFISLFGTIIFGTITLCLFFGKKTIKH